MDGRSCTATGPRNRVTLSAQSVTICPIQPPRVSALRASRDRDGADVTESDIEASGKLRIELKPLLEHQIQDALFQDYDKNNIKKIGRSFRQPQLLTGETADMNRSTAAVAKAACAATNSRPQALNTFGRSTARRIQDPVLSSLVITRTCKANAGWRV